MQTVILGLNPFDAESWTKHEVEDVRQFLNDQFDIWPEHAKIYHNEVAACFEVTPRNRLDVQKLSELDGLIYVINFPGDPITAIIAVVAVVATAAVAFLFMPAMPTMKNTQTQSPNNALADRGNQARPGGRIPDIFGTVRATPDLLSVPYKIFKNNQEIEIAYMCIGKGDYEISNIFDDTTPIEQIEGASVQVYGPGTSPNSGTPIVQIGSPITSPMVNAKRFSSANGQVLRPPVGAVSYNVDCKFHYPNKLIATATTLSYAGEFGVYEIETDLTQYFSPGDQVNIGAFDYVDGSDTYNLSGEGYIVFSVTPTEIVFDNPDAINPQWLDLTDLPGDETGFVTTSLVGANNSWIGPFAMQVPDLSLVIVNVVALQGLYKDNGKNQYSFHADIELELTPVDAAGVAIGAPEIFSETLVGSANDRSTRAITIYAEPTFTGPCRARLRRSSDTDYSFEGTVVDEVKWRDLYAISPVTESDFGNVTTVFAATYATEGALTLKDRKLNMLVTRKLPLRVSGTTFTSELYPTNNAADILVAMALDPYIGGRSMSELDIDNIYSTVAEVIEYFGTDLAAEFCYTFDKENLSFEESAQAVAAAIFCQAYRRGSIIKLFFEKAVEDSRMIFNHRNKLPKSETRTIRFGRNNDYDGIEYKYVSPLDDAIVTYYIPEDRSAVKPKKIESLGQRNFYQAHFSAWRAWQKIVYQNITTEFSATAEADLLIPRERILVTDNTRSGAKEGQVESQDGLTLTLSQPFEPELGIDYTIFLQHVNKTVQAIELAPGANNPYQVMLSEAPSMPLSLDPENFAVATYQIVGNNEPRGSAFLLAEKEPRGNLTLTLSAINYDARYYAKDKDLIEELI